MQPFLLDALHYVISTFWTEPSRLEVGVLECMRRPGKLFKPPILAQLNTIFKDEHLLWFEYFKYSWIHDSRHHPASISELVATIEGSEDRLLILVSGRETGTQEHYLLGICIPYPNRDGHRIQPKQEQDWPTCSLFELSPVQSVFGGNLECPAWTLSGEEILFGDPENGVALVLKNGLSQASFTQSVKGPSEPIYRPTPWRGSFSIDLEVDGIEICYEDNSISTEESTDSDRNDYGSETMEH